MFPQGSSNSEPGNGLSSNYYMRITAGPGGSHCTLCTYVVWDYTPFRKDNGSIHILIIYRVTWESANNNNNTNNI